tara:strand:+ start:990 stop:1889 length:900 start_codon:yes stop_codon:yes gene_type:complete
MNTHSITSLVTANNSIAKFTFLPKFDLIKSKKYNSVDEAKESPLVQQMFYLPFVKSVILSPDGLELEKFDILEWEDVLEEVALEIKNYLKQGGVIFNELETSKKNPVTIYAESTPNPEVIKFVANKKLVNEILEFKTKKSAYNTPIALALYKFPYVKEVFLNENYISVTKNSTTTWEDSVIEIREFIRSYIEENNSILNFTDKKVVNKKVDVSKEYESLDETSKKIISIIDDYIKPAVASDGGNILFESYKKEDKSVNVILQGACSGCPSSTFTLKNGIETMLKEMLPGKISTVNAVNG